MTTDALRRLQALRGQPHPVSALAALAQVQGDLRIVIEAVLELAGREHTCPCGQDTPATVSESDEPVADEQVTDRDGYVWQRFEGGWRWWRGKVGRWSRIPRTRDYMQTVFGPLRATTDDDRRRVGLSVRDEDAPPEPVEPAQADAQPEAEDPESENGRENGAGRIGWLRVRPDYEFRCLAQEVPGGWTGIDDADDLLWTAKKWPNAEFTPIRTLAADEVAVKRSDLRSVLGMVWLHESVPAAKREAADRLRAALEAGR